jgi:hypothetical protein
MAIACKNGDNLEIIGAINTAFEEANTITANGNKLVYRRMDDKRRNSMGRAKGQVWVPKALRIKELSADVCRYIDGLKQQLQVMEENNNSDIRNLLDKNGHHLYQALVAYQQDILNFDMKEFADTPWFMAWLEKDRKTLFKEIARSVETINDSAEGTLLSENAWMVNNFANTTKQLAIIVLNKLKNDVLSSERVMIEYFNNMFTDSFCGYYDIMAIALLNSAHIKARERLELTAGVGYFRFSEAYPRITINDSDVLTDHSDMAVYKLKVNGHPGKYTIPVTIEYYISRNKIATFTKQLEYTITQ